MSDLRSLSDILNTRRVVWVKNYQTSEWFDFLRLNLSSAYFINKKGVYVIWYTSPQEARVIRVGQGNIGQRLSEHRANPKITQYSKYGTLKVTWALSDGTYFKEQDLNGIEKYLARIYSPLEGDIYPTSDKEIQVNLIE